MNAQRIGVIAFLLATMATLSACGASGGSTGSTPTIQMPGVTPTPIIGGSSAVATPTEDCAFAMASFYGSDPTSPVAPLQAKIKAGLEADNVKVNDLQVEGLGETCANRQGLGNKFCCMATNISFSLPVDDLQDREALGNLLGKALKVIFRAEGYIGGHINTTFVASGGQEQLSFNDVAGRQALDKGLIGAALLAALANP